MGRIHTGHELDQIPRLYKTDHIATENILIYLRFFLGGCDWFIAEYNGDDLFFRFTILSSDYDMAEWDRISFSELKAISSMAWESAAICSGLRP